MPAFLYPPAVAMPGYGSPGNNGSVLGDAFTATPTTITIAATTTTPSGGTPFNLDGGPAPSKGKIRFRTSSVSAAVTTAVVFTVTDGTTTEQVHAIGASAAGVLLDYTFEFITDLSITSVSAVITLGGTVGTGITADFGVSMVS